MDKILRVTTRFDNFYPSDVTVHCNTHSGIIEYSVYQSLASNNYSSDSSVYKNLSSIACGLESGFSVSLLNELILFLNFKIEVITNVWVYDFMATKNTSVDLYLGSYALRKSRAKFMSPTRIIGFSRLKVFLNSEYEGNTYDFIFDPIKRDMWYCMVGVFAIACLAFFGIHYFNQKYKVDHLCCEIYPGQVLSDAIFETIAVVLQKGNISLFRNYGLTFKIVSASISVASLLTFIALSGAATAIASISKHTINSLEGLVQSNYDIFLDKGYGNGSYAQSVFEELGRTNVVFQNLLNRAEKSKIKFESFEKSMLRVQNGPVACVTEEDTGYISIINSGIGSSIPCSWTALSMSEIKYPWTMYMAKDSIYKADINNLLLKMAERGMIRRYQNLWWGALANSAQTCFQNKHDTEPSVNIDKLKSICRIFLIGLVFSLIVRIVEMGYLKYRC